MPRGKKKALRVNWGPVFNAICSDIGEQLFAITRRKREVFKSNDTTALRDALFADLQGISHKSPPREQEQQLAKMILTALEYGAANGMDLGARVYDMANAPLKLRNGQTPLALRNASSL